MTVGEGTSLDVLTGESQRVAFDAQRAECEGFASGPVESCFADRHFAAVFENSRDFFVDMKTRWNVAGFLEDFGGQFRCDIGFGIQVGRFGAAEVTLPYSGQGLQVMDKGLALCQFEFAGQLLVPILGDRIGFKTAHTVHAQKVIEIGFANPFFRIDGRVHQRLGESWFIRLVMSEFTVGIHVDDDIFLELFAEVHGDRDDLCDGFGVLDVDVKDRDF